MARRQIKEGLIETFISLPWWVSLVAGLMSYAALQWLVPMMFSGRAPLIGLSSAMQSVAWLPLFLFGVTGVIAFCRQQLETRHILKGEVGRHGAQTRNEPIFVNTSGASVRDRVLDLPREAPVVAANEVFDSWTLPALRALEWKRFELLCAKYYEGMGFRSDTIRCGADGGIDVKLFKDDPNKPLAVIQCKAWNTQVVGVKEVRELLGVMAHEKVSRGIFVTTGSYTADAREFGRANPILMLDGEGFVKKLQELSVEHQASLLQYAFDGDYRTPTCASCGIKMVKREGKKGTFWGCSGYPRCKSTFAMKPLNV
jgi:restriction system protein